ncbi:MAG: general secretion pathway protein GspK [Halanaerobiales bacterium]|nr:general secretion pathway protein GspK [Halanaerobiales bacterium]
MRPWESEDGVALIIVLWTIVLLSFLLVSLSEDVQLESFLTRNILDETQLQYIALAGISRGIGELTRDQTLADGKDESWLKSIQAQMENQGEFEVSIDEIGSRFNINFVNEQILEGLIGNYAEDFIRWRYEQDGFDVIVQLEEFTSTIQEKDFKTIEDYVTFYGKFNLATDDYEMFKKILLGKRVSEWVADQVIQELKSLEEPLNSLEELILKVPGLDSSTVDLLSEEIDVKGNININLVDEEILSYLTECLDVSKEQVSSLVEYRKENTIEDLEVLKGVLGEEDYKKIAPYLTVSSEYFRITSKARSLTSSLEKVIIVEVLRIPEEMNKDQVLEWRTEILSWIES